MHRGATGLCLATILLIGFASVSPAFGQDPAAAEPKLLIGVRSDARPFSYKLPPNTVASDATRGPLGWKGYGGYMVRICDAVLAEMLVDPRTSKQLTLDEVQVYDIDKHYQARTKVYDELKKAYDEHKKRAEEASKSGSQPSGGTNTPRQEASGTPTEPPEVITPSQSRFDDLGVQYDILCDPATITNDRREVYVSPPLFLTGISYLTLKGVATPQDGCGDPRPKDDKAADTAARTNLNPPAQPNSASVNGGTKKEKPKKPALIGLVGGTTAEGRGLQALIDAREMPEFEDKLVAQLRSKDGQSVCEKNKVLVKRYANHQEAARDFCAGGAFYYYLGDLEIIRTYVGAIPGCKFENGVVTYTNDRYGIFGKAIGPSDQSTGPSGQVSRPHPSVKMDPASISARQLLVARFFEILAQKVLFNPSVLDKAYSDTFPNLPQSRKLKLFYWAIRGEWQPEPVTPGKIAPVKKEDETDTQGGTTSPAGKTAPAASGAAVQTPG